MTDHLEPYRQMVRSIRFVPPLRRTQPSDHQVASPPPHHLRTDLSVKVSKAIPAAEPALNHSEHIAALVQEAVSRPTVPPVTYRILENIGDRISRLATAKPVIPIIIPPKIPQPDPNWKPTALVATRQIESDQEPVVAKLADASTSVAPYDEPRNGAAAARVEIEATSAPNLPSLETPAGEDKLADAVAPVLSESDQEPVVAKLADSSTSVVPYDEPRSGAAAARVEIEATSAPNLPSLETPAVEKLSDAALVAPQHIESEQQYVVETKATETTAPVSLADKPAQIEETPDSVLEADAATAMVEVEQASVETLPPSQQDTALDNSKLNSADSVVARTTTAAPAAELEEAQHQLKPAIEVVPDALKNPADDLDDSAVAPALPTDREALDKKKEIQIQCPKCESGNLKKNGRYNGKQKYACKDCGKKFVLSDSFEEKTAEQTKANSSASTPKAKPSQVDVDFPAKQQKAVKNSGKNRAKGFGRP